MVRSWVLALISSIGISAVSMAHPADAPLHSDLKRAIEKEGAAFVQAGNTDGLSIAIVRDGHTEYFNFGTTVRGKVNLPNQNTVYEIGSVTKTFTSLLLAHAIVEKKASASDDIRHYLPGAFPNLQFQGTPVTLMDLVTTTSALPDNLPDFMVLLKTVGPDKAPQAIMAMLQHYSAKALLDDLPNASLSSKPGTTPKHSNVAPELLGLMLEKMYGQSYATLLSNYVEKPAGMQSGVAKDRLPEMASGYMTSADAMPLISTVDFILPAGGLRYSASDMAKYIALQLDTSNPAIALTHRVAWGDINQQAVGFDWKISKTDDGKTRLSHDGGTFGFSSFVDLYPDAHEGIVLLANRSGPMTQDQLRMLSDQIRKDF
ncbi:MAG: serine hydrolase domain-containing protein [Rhodanobacter sp.]